MRRSMLSWVFLSVLASACGCVLGNGPANTPADDTAGEAPAKAKDKHDGARVAAEWQKQMLARLEKSGADVTDAWGLFSSGGWSDAGQVMIFGGAKAASSQLAVVDANKKVIGTDRVVAAAELKGFAEKTQLADTLPDVDITAFDLLVYEYVHAVKGEGGKVAVTHRFYLRNPGSKPTPDHDAVVAAFQAFRKKAP